MSREHRRAVRTRQRRRRGYGVFGVDLRLSRFPKRALSTNGLARRRAATLWPLPPTHPDRRAARAKHRRHPCRGLDRRSTADGPPGAASESWRSPRRPRRRNPF